MLRVEGLSFIVLRCVSFHQSPFHFMRKTLFLQSTLHAQVTDYLSNPPSQSEQACSSNDLLIHNHNLSSKQLPVPKPISVYKPIATATW